MLTPHAIVRTRDLDAHEPDDALWGPELDLVSIRNDGLTVLASSNASAHARGSGLEPAPEAFMDAACVIHDRLTCLPMRLDEPVDRADLVRLLRAGADRFARLLDLVEGCDEWSIRFADDASPDGATPEPTHAPATDGRGYLESRRLATLDPGVHACTRRRIASFQRVFTPTSRETRLINTESGPSLALLTPRAGEHELVATFKERCAVDDSRAGAPHTTLTGPWPPFSFVTADL